MPNDICHQIVNVAAGKLNAVDDAAIGGPPNTTTGTARFGGQLGSRLVLSHEDAAKMSKASIGTLYGGVYQYVQTKAASTAAPARGLVAFYATAADRQAFIVTPDCPTGTGCIAGVYIGAPTKGNYCWIQAKGLATVKFRASITKATPAAQDLVICQAAANVADVLADATALTSVEVRSILGIASEVPVNGDLKLVELRPGFDNF